MRAEQKKVREGKMMPACLMPLENTARDPERKIL